MKLLIDEQLPPQLKPWFAARDCNAAHVFDIGLKSAPDHRIADYASKQGYILVSKDDDFIELARRLGVQLLLIKCGNLITPKLIALLELRWPEAAPLLQDCNPLVIVQ
jgi:predicted nuclease of predicted toxin-antitoxin system